MHVSGTNKGQALILALIMVSSAIVIVLAITSTTAYNSFVLRKETRRTLAFQLAEAGIDRALWCLNKPAVCGNPYIGETTQLGAGSFSVSVAVVGDNKEVTSVGTTGNVQRTIRVTATDEPATSEASFYYGVQVGEGGLNMDNNAIVKGNVYSNGSITAGNNAEIQGSVIVAGGTALTPDQSQIVQSSEYDVGRTTNETDAAQSFKAGETNVMNKISLYIKKVGSPSNATMHIVTDNAGLPGTTELASGTLNATLVTTTYGWIDITFNTTPPLIKGSTYWIIFDVGSKNASKYWIWGAHDNAGYGNGIGMFSKDWGSDPWQSANADFGFKVFMGGVPTSITGLRVPATAGGFVHANTIQTSNISANVECQIMESTTVAGDVECGSINQGTIAGNVTAENVTNSVISGNLTCETESSNTVSGVKTCPTAVDPPVDAPPENMPISNAQIKQWEIDAEIGGVVTPPGGVGTTYTVPNGTTLGPVKIDGNLFITNSAQVTMNGIIWVKGNLTIDNNADIKLSPSFGSQSSVIIVDDPSYQQTQGKVVINNNGDIQGSGAADSYVMVASTNKGITALTDPAIHIQNNVSGAIFFTSQGMLEISNNAELNEATGYLLQLDNNVEVTYESGLASTSFTSGPGGIWRALDETWEEL
ncbi:MAG: hypothetical protein A2898_04355 [Candidatus Kerfeldbacteria bacterium RIFCSPLOWO2_01_FULL_48_11]|uniref:Type 4 fimbrial biogenesis protein PilX N-terminal domain-containing protein n=1 Tax=Candidatus Kerfeldbacteria bacterium RIFCSPLOWO2_01_FULL_48_11 TaxID=1798543 RepID=A0A1G2B0W3_9BACT|nr:MAG: hypothetical protein UY34_C0001G0076 [Parcubacteria group bacterium GW2011_GWA2_48_9]KKW16591.1 MAG: hypothetical protein UY52_C0002G0005 [Parcubacteria group bacterium GW2011_GWC2_49_9]OGY82798.1 MAG: hypothetical protein A2898_04355 [Candidatus Kerfeldbacteria bacterium RIFCSPLOWO2_01_FULL_48_11]HCJ52476.1 hypothetical protein [Candidatus Kerfeldbacteria bacterium]